MKPPKRPRDPNQLAKMIVDLSTGQLLSESHSETNPNESIVRRGRAGGLKGGRSRDAVLSAERKSEIARSAANKRWSKTDANQD